MLIAWLQHALVACRLLSRKAVCGADSCLHASLERDVLVGHIVLPLRKLESQKMMRQFYPIMHEVFALALQFSDMISS